MEILNLPACSWSSSSYFSDSFAVSVYVLGSLTPSFFFFLALFLKTSTFLVSIIKLSFNPGNTFSVIFSPCFSILLKSFSSFVNCFKLCEYFEASFVPSFALGFLNLNPSFFFFSLFKVSSFSG